MDYKLRLIVGLGNPGDNYKKTRHNAGFWFVESVARKYAVFFREESGFDGELARFEYGKNSVLLLKPGTFMNHSGRSVNSVMRYFKIDEKEVLIAHDELDFIPGVVKLKSDGGHGGHNGIKDIINQIGSGGFSRLRIGIGHPGDKSKVSQYVLDKPTHRESEQISDAISLAINHLNELLDGEFNKVMNIVNSGKIGGL